MIPRQGPHSGTPTNIKQLQMDLASYFGAIGSKAANTQQRHLWQQTTMTGASDVMKGET
jgi:hypothetical protein